MVLDGQLINYYNDYETGYLYRDVQDSVVRGYELAGMFPRQAVDTKDITVIESNPVNKFTDKYGNQVKVAKGAKVRVIKGEVPESGGFKLVYRGFEYIIENQDMENPTFDLYEDIRAMGYEIGTMIEESVAKAFRTYAAEEGMAVADADFHGKWDDEATTMQDLIDDYVEMERVARPTKYRLNWFGLGDKAHGELAKKCGKSIEKYTIPQNQFTIDSAINFQNAQSFYGGKYLTDGEIFGGDLNNPGLKLYFKRFPNTNVKSAPMPKGLEKLAPPVGFLMYDNSKEELEPQTMIKMGACWVVAPRDKGKGLFYKQNALTA
jgi:hypothetical protein